MAQGLLRRPTHMKRLLVTLFCILAGTAVAAEAPLPVITPNVSGELGENGWFIGDVGLVWSVGEGDRTTRVRTGCENTVVTWDTRGEAFLCAATTSRGTTTSTYVIRRDSTPPVIHYRNNAQAYAVDQLIDITCEVTDETSGVTSSVCPGVRGPAYRFPLGPNTLATTVADNAGNTAEGDVTFRVVVTTDSLATLVDAWVTSTSIARNLRRRLTRERVDAFIALVERESGKSLSPEHASELIRLAGSL